MRLFTIPLAFILLLTACAAPAQPTIASTDASASKSEVPILDGTFETSLLVSEWRGSSEGNVLFPLDPANGTALAGYPPISLGHTFTYAFSPDRQTLAVVSFPNDTNSPGTVLLIDLPGWKLQDLDLELRSWVHSMAFSPDGTQLAIAHGESRFRLTMVDLEERAIVAQGPTDFYVSHLKFTENSQELMLYHPTIDAANGAIAGPPQVLLLAAKDLTPRWSAALDEVHDGIFPKDENVTPQNLYEPGQALYLSPALVFAPDRDTLYIVHADSAQLTTVDFGGQTVNTVDIQPKLTWFERILSMTAGTAHAKIGDGITRQAVISPDGQFLYVVGTNNSTFLDQNASWQMQQTSHGLEILQTSDGSRVEHIETDTTDLSISPDGRFLYLRNWGNNQDNIPWTDIFDTSSRQRINHMSGISAMPALLMNETVLLVSTYATSETSHHMSILELDGSKVLMEWTAPTSLWWVTTP